MSQHDGTIANDSGAAVRLDIQAAIQALFSNSAGNTAPSGPYQGQVFIDTNTPSGTVWNIQRWSGSAWHTEAIWDTVAGTITAQAAITPTKIENGTSKVEISASNGAIIATVAGNETMRWDTSRRIMTGGGTTPANGYTGVGAITLPLSIGIRAMNTLSAWAANVTGAGAMGASFNMASVGRPGTGVYTFNFTNALPSANYVCSVTPVYIATAAAAYYYTKTTTSFQGIFTNPSSGVLDPTTVDAMVSGPT